MLFFRTSFGFKCPHFYLSETMLLFTCVAWRCSTVFLLFGSAFVQHAVNTEQSAAAASAVPFPEASLQCCLLLLLLEQKLNHCCLSLSGLRHHHTHARACAHSRTHTHTHAVSLSSLLCLPIIVTMATILEYGLWIHPLLPGHCLAAYLSPS